MIDVAKLRYDLVAVTPQGQRLHLQEALRGLSWEENPGELAVRLEAEVQNQKHGSAWLHQLLPLGGQVLLYADTGTGPQEVVRGTVFGWDYRTDPLGHLTLTAYDQLINLMRSKDDRYYPAGSLARTIIQDIAGAWGIPLGAIDGPDTALAKQVFRGQTLGDMILSVLDQVKRRGGGRWIVRSRQGVIDVIRAGQNGPVYHFGAGDTVSQLGDRQDIEDLVTRVKIIGSADDDARAPVLAQLDGRTEFGVLQDIVIQSQSDTPASAKAEAQAILSERGQPRKQRTVTAPDVPFLRWGDKVHITAGTLNGYYLVAGVQHDADARTMTMEVEDAA